MLLLEAPQNQNETILRSKVLTLREDIGELGYGESAVDAANVDLQSMLRNFFFFVSDGDSQCQKEN